jgi:hypothetical protein
MHITNYTKDLNKICSLTVFQDLIITLCSLSRVNDFSEEPASSIFTEGYIPDESISTTNGCNLASFRFLSLNFMTSKISSIYVVCTENIVYF